MLLGTYFKSTGIKFKFFNRNSIVMHLKTITQIFNETILYY